ncbi:MAG: ATP synthase F1 subunit delta [Cryomorphaceae bacterium]|nr:ATP synthase F1 subunit delta [Flavobacteriales bacterium]
MHKDLQISRRYAKSLLDFAVNENKIDEVAADMTLIAKVFNENIELVKLLHSPLIKPDTKVKVMSKIFGKKIGVIVDKFVKIIIAKRREDILPGIAISFENQLRKYNGIVLAEVTTAIALDDDLRAKVKALIKKTYDKVEIKEYVDPDIIGGIVIKVGDLEYDDTILSRIGDIRRLQLSNPYVSQL